MQETLDSGRPSLHPVEHGAPAEIAVRGTGYERGASRTGGVGVIGLCRILIACESLVLGAAAQEPAEPAHPVAPAAAQTEQPPDQRWIDPEDGWFDLTRFLEDPYGFLPLVVPITEPALGFGAVAGAAFLNPREEAGEEGWARPNITVVGGLATEDGSEGLFGGNSSIWSGGDLHTLFGGGHLSLELELHGIGDDPRLGDDALDYNLVADAFVGEGRRRLGDSDLWLGLRYAYARTTVDFEGSAEGIQGVDPEDDSVEIAGPAVALRYDSLDNMFTPTTGTLSDTSLSVFGEVFGGSRDFELVQQVLIHYRPLSEDLFLGMRGQFNWSSSDTPFYARPYIGLRGVPALRYQGEQAASAELELRWQFHPRFGLVGFGGAGLAWTDGEHFESEQDAYSGGLGLRYLLSRKFGLHAGIDVARGPEESAIYVQFGSAWVRP
jgi:hypothetical protein